MKVSHCTKKEILEVLFRRFDSTTAGDSTMRCFCPKSCYKLHPIPCPPHASNSANRTTEFLGIRSSPDIGR